MNSSFHEHSESSSRREDDLESMVKKLHESIRLDGSVSELTQSVNDSARGYEFDEIYDKKEVLGEGGYAIVYRCIHKHRRLSYAVKEVFNENYDVDGENLKEEIDALKKLRDGSYIVRLLDVFTGPEQTHLVMEQMMVGTCLLGWMKRKYSPKMNLVE